jgi:hypothetical protein
MRWGRGGDEGTTNLIVSQLHETNRNSGQAGERSVPTIKESLPDEVSNVVSGW